MLRSIMAQAGLRGPLAPAKFTVVRLTKDQILENATGVGAPSSTWPRTELAADILHKALYALSTPSSPAPSPTGSRPSTALGRGNVMQPAVPAATLTSVPFPATPTADKPAALP
ncbi:hypothetical protein [Streptomyces sp. NPDC058335]|uniref:hypothetical protein n=1 Tax=Streptomyces sp. NPDC058335 TaxID=3346451 RepID=UPI0036572A1C